MVTIFSNVLSHLLVIFTIIFSFFLFPSLYLCFYLCLIESFGSESIESNASRWWHAGAWYGAFTILFRKFICLCVCVDCMLNAPVSGTSPLPRTCPNWPHVNMFCLSLCPSPCVVHGLCVDRIPTCDLHHPSNPSPSRPYTRNLLTRMVRWYRTRYVSFSLSLLVHMSQFCLDCTLFCYICPTYLNLITSPSSVAVHVSSLSSRPETRCAHGSTSRLQRKWYYLCLYFYLIAIFTQQPAAGVPGQPLMPNNMDPSRQGKLSSCPCLHAFGLLFSVV